ncbi:MAG TPA: hypothetical protein VGD84_03140 [Pseudonocardiaceae bacterium]
MPTDQQRTPLIEPAPRSGESRHCAWCGRRLPDDTKDGKVGRPRRYCAQPCRQRAYERRTAVQRGGLPDNAVILSATELADLQDRLFQLRCAAEDVLTALDDGATTTELRKLATELQHTARDLERLR